MDLLEDKEDSETAKKRETDNTTSNHTAKTYTDQYNDVTRYR